jgi:hypothetical protein
MLKTMRGLSALPKSSKQATNIAECKRRSIINRSASERILSGSLEYCLRVPLDSIEVTGIILYAWGSSGDTHWIAMHRLPLQAQKKTLRVFYVSHRSECSYTRQTISFTELRSPQSDGWSRRKNSALCIDQDNPLAISY